MTPKEFQQKLIENANEIKAYATNRFPTKAGDTALRFINGNFRAQGFQGRTFQKWKPKKGGGTILVNTDKLRASTYYTTQPGQITIKNTMAYAKAHNEGFKGRVSVKAHTRNRYDTEEIETGQVTRKGHKRKRKMTFKSGEVNVKAHTRKMNIPQRQFVPTKKNPSPVLNNAIEREMKRDLIKILN